MMKIQRIRMIWAAAVLLAAGCSQEQATDKEMYSDVLIAPRSSVADGKIRPLTDDGATRAGVDGITQELTFYFRRAHETGLGTGTYEAYDNAVFPAVRTAGTGAQLLTFTPSLSYLVSSAKSKLTGWYPEATSVASGVPSWTLDGTQDVLTATAQEGSKTSPMPTLAFQHALSQLHFRFQAKDASMQAAWGSITAIRVLAQPAVCRYDPATDDGTGNVSFDPADPTATFEAKNITTGVVPTTPTVMSDPMMIVPQTATVLTLEIETSTGEKAEAKIGSTTYKPGKAYNIDLYLGEVEVTGDASIGAWITEDKPQAPALPMETINLSKAGTANCYLITENNNGHYYFDATVRGNGNESTTDANVKGIRYSTLPVLATAKEARVLWQTGTSATTGLVVNPASVMLKGGKVRFSLGDATEGNAVIGIFASADPKAPCLWSWHIWCVNGLPADVDCVKTPSPNTASPTFKMMALNLGAYNNATGDPKSIGLMYQWGRKDPFPGPKGFTAKEPTNIYGSYNNNGTVGTWNGAYSIQALATGSTIGTEAWAVQYPGVFITNGTDPYDWMYYANDYLWGTPWVAAGSVSSYNGNQGAKSIYDPCPVGYRVPPQDTWSLQTTAGSFTNSGMILEKVAAGFWFPAAGIRHGYSVGELTYAGYGYYWSSSPYDATNIYAGYLNFNSSGGVTPRGSNLRAHGLSVRCVAE